ncbi:MAG: polyprenyl diphosphate synthase [Mariprofundales bacterium]
MNDSQVVLNIPKHVAIIMDGNGRWAKQRGFPRLEGHRRGAIVARKVVEWAADAGVRYISLFAFSTENWSRPSLEVQGLMRLLATLLPTQISDMKKEGVRLRVIGDITPMPKTAKRAVERAMQATKDCQRIDLILCLNYGGRQEIVQAAIKMARWARHQDEATLDEVSPQQFRQFMSCANYPAVDLLIRTGGEQRISNFYVWDAAYAELYFSNTYWPAFTQQDLQNALDDYAGRERRFGLTGEQV